MFRLPKPGDVLIDDLTAKDCPPLIVQVLKVLPSGHLETFILSVDKSRQNDNHKVGSVHNYGNRDWSVIPDLKRLLNLKGIEEC